MDSTITWAPQWNSKQVPFFVARMATIKQEMNPAAPYKPSTLCKPIILKFHANQDTHQVINSSSNWIDFQNKSTRQFSPNNWRSKKHNCSILHEWTGFKSVSLMYNNGQLYLGLACYNLYNKISSLWGSSGCLTQINSTIIRESISNSIWGSFQQMIGLSVPSLLSCFISSLKPHKRHEVQALQPTSLSQAIWLVKLQEYKYLDLKGLPKFN